MHRNAFPTITLILLALLTLPGCGAAGSPSSTSHRPPLRVEYTQWEGDYTLLIAQEKGFFAKYGVEVDPVYYPMFRKAVTDIAINQIDGGLFAISDLLSVSAVADVKGVAVYDSGGTSKIAARLDIQDTAGLKGKRVGVIHGDFGELFIDESLKSAGLASGDVTMVEVPPEEVPEKLTAGEIDAGYVWTPYDQKAVAAGFKLLPTLPETASLSPDVVVFRESVLKERPEDVRAFMKAWFEALDYRLKNVDASNAMIAQATGLKSQDVAQTGEIKLYNLDDNLKLFDENQSGSSSIFYASRVNREFQIAHGSMTMAPNLTNLLDSSFLH